MQESGLSESTPSVQLTGVIIGFGGNGWPSVRLSPESEQLSLSRSRIVLAEPFVPSGTLLMRGQKLKLELADGGQQHGPAPASRSWKAIAVLAEAPGRRKCIHPTRVAALCADCPRRKASKGIRSR